MARFAARLVDLAGGLLLTYLLHWPLGRYFADRAVITFKVGVPGTIWKGLLPWLLDLTGPFSYTLPFAFFLYLLPEAIWGRSWGQMLFKLPPRSGQLWADFLLKTLGLWGTAIALISGSWPLVVIFLSLWFLVGLVRIFAILYPIHRKRGNK